MKKNKKNSKEEDNNLSNTDDLKEEEIIKNLKVNIDEKGPLESNEENKEEDRFSRISLELEDAIDQKQRALAEAENTRRRSSKELEQARKYGHLTFSRDMLTVIDSLEKAVNTIPNDKNNLSDELKNFIIGIEMTLDQIKQVYTNYNIVQINPEGEKFDYNFHQAMFEKETEDVEPGTIIEVLQPGWKLHDRLLRPAMVGVSKEPSEESEK